MASRSAVSDSGLHQMALGNLALQQIFVGGGGVIHRVGIRSVGGLPVGGFFSNHAELIGLFRLLGIGLHGTGRRFRRGALLRRGLL